MWMRGPPRALAPFLGTSPGLKDQRGYGPPMRCVIPTALLPALLSPSCQHSLSSLTRGSGLSLQTVPSGCQGTSQSPAEVPADLSLWSLNGTKWGALAEASG